MITTFFSYLLMIRIRYGILDTISSSYYQLPQNQKWLFTIFCWSFAIPAMILGDSVLMFLAGACICFTGAAAAYKQEMTSTVHIVGAVGGVLFSQLSIWLDYPLSEGIWLYSVYFLICTGVLYFLKVKTYWIEVFAFTTIMCVLLLKIL
jgi:hypothetical protein